MYVCMYNWYDDDDNDVYIYATTVRNDEYGTKSKV